MREQSATGRTVVLLIDYDNLQICASRDTPGQDLDLQAVMALAQSYGTVLVARAYAEWNHLSERLSTYRAGIEPAFAPVLRTEASGRNGGKSLADTVIVADGVDLLWRMSPDVFVLATSDKDLIPLVRLAKQRGSDVVIVGSDLTAVQLVEVASYFVTYRQLVGDYQPERERERVQERERMRMSHEARRDEAMRTRETRRQVRTVAAERPADEERPRPAPAAAEAAAAPALSAGELALAVGAAGEGAPRRRRRRRRRGPGEGGEGAEAQAGYPETDERGEEALEAAESALAPGATPFDFPALDRDGPDEATAGGLLPGVPPSPEAPEPGQGEFDDAGQPLESAAARPVVRRRRPRVRKPPTPAG